MRILMVTPYPPTRDGIAAYAIQAVSALRRDGHEVEVLSPGPSAAHHHLDLVGPRGALALAKRVRSYDRLIVQFHADIFFPVPHGRSERAIGSAALAVAFRAARHVEVRVHEIDYTWGNGSGAAEIATRALWQSVDRIVVHTPAERDDFARAFRVPIDRVEVEAHGSQFAPRVADDRSTARHRLGIPQEPVMLLAIGFIQPHKGFDRAIRAFDGMDRAGCRLEVVGSVRIEDPAFVAHLEELEQLAAATPGVTLHVGYMSDADFDRWLVASDVVVLPYRSIWSSGVMERALLYDRPVVATRVGALADQAADRPGVTIVGNDIELASAMRAAAGREAEAFAHSPWPAEGRDRAVVQAEIQARAAGLRRPSSPVASLNRPPLARETSAPLRRVPLLALPPPVSARPGAALVKRLIRRATAWQMDAVVHQLNSVHEATIEAVERVEQPGRP